MLVPHRFRRSLAVRLALLAVVLIVGAQAYLHPASDFWRAALAGVVIGVTVWVTAASRRAALCG
jgi:hypothetical protein